MDQRVAVFGSVVVIAVWLSGIQAQRLLGLGGLAGGGLRAVMNPSESPHDKLSTVRC